MLPTELQDALQLVEQAKELAPVVGLALLAIPGVAVAVHMLGRWTWED
jgi:hypothetical protein